jgi:Outer membrane protein beta-barrel domain
MMRKIVALALFCIVAIATQAQMDSTAPVRKHKYSMMKVPKDRIYVDLLATNWLTGANGLSTRWYSRGINFGAMYDFQIMKSRVSFAAGLGLSWVNVYSAKKLVDSVSSGAQFVNLDTPYSFYKVNKVVVLYLDVPLELRIRTNRDKLDNVWKFNVGFKVGIRLDAYTKRSLINTSWSPNTYIDVIKESPYPDFNLLRMGPTVRIGYASFNITGYYGILGVFKAGRGPDIHEWSLGVSFNGL